MREFLDGLLRQEPLHFIRKPLRPAIIKRNGRRIHKRQHEIENEHYRTENKKQTNDHIMLSFKRFVGFG
jgi:hypothetical protein